MGIISSDRFLEFRKLQGLSQSGMGKMLGVTGKYVGMIERGEKPVAEDVPLGLLFQTYESGAKPVEQKVNGSLREVAPEYRLRPISVATRMIPVIGWAHAGGAGRYEELPKSWQDQIPTECRDEKAFAVRLEGDSMEQEFGDGDVLVLMPGEEVYSGCFAVCRFTDDGVLFRRVEFSGRRIQLVPLNSRYGVTMHEREEFAWIFPVWGRWSQLWKR